MIKKPIKPKPPLEHTEQVLFVQWARRMGFPIFAIPNGGQRHRVVAAKLKLEGVRAGVPDLFLPIPVGEYHGLFIEMKRQTGSGLSSEQKTWKRTLEANGYKVIIGTGAKSAREQTLEYIREDKDLKSYSTKTNGELRRNYEKLF